MRNIGYWFYGKGEEDKSSSSATEALAEVKKRTKFSSSFTSFGSSVGEEKSELIFVRPPKGYPRFHIYLKIKEENLIFNLHLDQKRPIYKGSPAHAGEYEGETVGKEAERIKQALQK